MKKHPTFNFLLLFGFLASTVAPLAAQESAPTMRQWFSSMPLPSLATGPGLKAAQTWWKAGRDMKALSSQEKKAFNQLKKRFAIGVIISAMLITFGGKKYLAHRSRAIAKQEWIAIGISNEDDLESFFEKLMSASEFIKTSMCKEVIDHDSLKFITTILKTPGINKTSVAKKAARYAIDNNKIKYFKIILQTPGIDKNEVAMSAVSAVISRGETNALKEVLCTPGINRSKVANVAAILIGKNNVHSEMIKIILSIPGINKHDIVKNAMLFVEENDDLTVTKLAKHFEISKKETRDYLNRFNSPA